ncbi:MAG: hypothetical protein Ta2B_16660 [Termitinemataceae bacterium]|nr:MAG: hypothetical protein Ta2B_16660 [Termitinemataceae bacterium]
MSSDENVIWKKGDAVMPDKARYVVDAARSELLLKTLQLPEEIVNTIRYNADKSAQSVNEYLSHIVAERLMSV